MTEGRLTGVGVGPGDPELVTVRAARLITEAGVIAYHCARHGNSIARAAAAPYLRPGQIEEILRYPVTTEGTSHPGGYAGALGDFYDDATARLAAHLEQGRDVVVLCEGDPGFYGSYQHLHVRLRGRFSAQIVPGVSSVSAAAAAVGQPLVQHDESLTVLAGTLPPDMLRARLAAAGGDPVAVLKLGREFAKVRAALADTDLLDRAQYVERAGAGEQRVAPLAEVDPSTVPYMSLALVPGQGGRAAAPPGVTVVGLGPGDPAWLTPESAAAVAGATDLVGYRPYLDRLPHRPGQHRHASGNTAESDRAALALGLAAKGGRVAVVSSGDPGVFAMASAVLEEAARDERWRDIDVDVLPGVTAAQAVAARAGAPLGHDYCVISLSDRLKPWEIVANRIGKAAAADLVLALYNPASRARTWQVGAVRDLVLRHRPPATPVIVGRGVGRPDEQVTITSLGELDPAGVDMSTLLIIGSSTTQVFEQHGRATVFTPRRYPPGTAGPGAEQRSAGPGAEPRSAGPGAEPRSAGPGREDAAGREAAPTPAGETAPGTGREPS